MAATPTDPLWIAASAGAPEYNANELRTAMALALMYDGRLVGGRKGVRSGGDQLKVSLAGSTITVQPGVFAADPGLTTTQGPYWAAILTADTHTLTAADGTNPRKDIVVATVYDHDEDASGLRRAITEYKVGTPAPSPSEPPLLAREIKLALIDVPATPGTPVVTDTRPWTVSPGGILPVRLAGDIAAGTEGRYRDRLDLNQLERDSGAAWETVADPALFKAWPSFVPVWSTTGTAPALGNGTLVGNALVRGKTIYVRIKLTAGTTTTFGTGNWQFTLPFTPLVQRDVLSALVVDNSSADTYALAARLNNSSPHINRVSGPGSTGTRGDVTGTFPFTWADGDTVVINGVYESV